MTVNVRTAPLPRAMELPAQNDPCAGRLPDEPGNG